MSLHELPSGWKWSHPEEITPNTPHSLVIGPFGSDLKTSDFVEDGVPVVFVRNVKPNAFIPEGGRFVTQEKAEALSAHAVRSGDLVVTKMGLPPCVTAIYPENTQDGIVTADIIKFSPDPGTAERRYLAHYLNSPLSNRFVERITNGVTRPKVTLRDFKSLPIPIPPLPEQRRIADILDKADAIRRKRQESLDLTEQFLRSAFLEMFGDPVTNPMGWSVVPMSDIIADSQYGTSERANQDGDGLPVLRMNNITYGGEIDLRSLKWCPIRNQELAKYTVGPGDLLFNRTNSPELVGKTAVWEGDSETYAYAGYLIRFRFHPELAQPHYVSAFLNSQYGKRYLLRKAKPSNNMSNFSATEFRQIRIPVPPVKAQQAYAEIRKHTVTLRNQLECAIEHSEAAFHSLVQRAFRGDL